ncbi:hypothetical protein AMATHDRAFT_48880 [Amanita thiersii Skay4041]|uniref:Fe2OG dioxygenase domain-containing protein n=1 Tax=Amanita thiersii Skay4041 TaxID=703135 RepID=A0A2A9NNE3_9AGAR|nr:hypothetical protein AMATHDRAFT_48880 [Amanita thiersii Skay4041]
MPRTHERSLSPDIPDVVKRIKISHEPSKDGNSPSIPSPTSPLVDPSDKFTEGLFNPDNISRLHNSYKDNSPFKFALIERLFRHDLLEKVKDECLSELSFAEKETDIYKVNQTGDLASLNFLAPNQLALLSNLRSLRDALYSTRFRKFLQSVTGCGPLSGVKQDMSVNSYSKGCHLLNHDDVIGTRRVSYILYMPLPSYQMWQKDWGGALELYPVRLGEDNQLEPEPIPEKSIPPSWNQFIFFEVQPGRSFHSVEEVVVGGEEDGRERLSISGWFHAAQEGEEGYEPVQESAVKSSREQLTSSSTSTFFNSYQDNTDDIMLPGDALPELYISYLSEFMNPVYLQPRTMKALAARFVEESSLELHSFLSNSLAKSLESRLRELDSKDGLGPERAGHIPPHTAGTGGGWIVKGPPHKWRYSVLKPRESGNVLAVFPRAAHVSSDEIIRSLQDELFPSPAFRAWLSIVSRLMPLRYRAEARRFRPGLDYTLATSEEKEARLDVVLDLTPEAQDRSTDDGRWQTKQQDDRGWHTGEWGGWDCYMAPHNEEDDPAVYRSGSSKVSSTQQSTPGHTSEGGGSGSGGVNGSSSSTNTSKQGSVHGSPHESKGNTPPTPMDEDEESTLLTAQPGFNRLLLVLRDERVMRFVKYVSASADGSRWDICGEYEVGMVQEEEEVS